jgi:hypothetical protein
VDETVRASARVVCAASARSWNCPLNHSCVRYFDKHSFMRDHMRYVDELQCAAARIVSAMRDRARRKNPQSHGEFDTFHIRRGDFQYKNTRIEAEEIYNNVSKKARRYTLPRTRETRHSLHH